MENSQYLEKLKTELNNYSQHLSDIGRRFEGKASDDMNNILYSLQDMLKEAKEAYIRLTSASAAEWEPMKEIAHQALENLKNSFNELLKSSSGQVQDYARKIEVYSEHQIENMADYVRENPLKSIFFALSTGFILGRLLK